MEYQIYNITLMGYKVKIKPHMIGIYDDNNNIEGENIPNKIVKYLIDEGFCDDWLDDESSIQVNIYKHKC